MISFKKNNLLKAIKLCLVLLLPFSLPTYAMFSGTEETLNDDYEALNTTTVIAFDGGGVRGIVSAVILDAIQQSINKSSKADPQRPMHVSEAFDVFAGTSTGSFIGIAATVPDENGDPFYNTSDIINLYKENAKDIFAGGLRSLLSLGGLIYPKYNNANLKKFINLTCQGRWLSESLSRLVIIAYDVDNEIPRVYDTALAKESAAHNFLLSDVAGSSSAAPTLFDPHNSVSENGTRERNVDGGVVSNNPIVSAMAAGRDMGLEKLFIVSIGTGTPIEKEKTTYSSQMGGFIRPLISIMFTGQTQMRESEAIRYTEGVHTYYRFQPKLPRKLMAMDNGSPANMQELIDEALKYVLQNQSIFDEIGDRLWDLRGNLT